MIKVGAEIMKNGGLEREEEGKETRRRIEGGRRAIQKGQSRKNRRGVV
jgi:hypothetical protein